MIDDIAKSIKATLYERATSPLFGTFAVSWIAWNYKLLFTLFGNGNYDAKFSYIDRFLYPNWHVCLLRGLAYPLLTALTFIIIYPWPARGVFVYWHRRLKEQKIEQQKIEDETPLTIEESKIIKMEAIKQRLEFEKELEAREDQIKSLKGFIAELEERLRDMETSSVSEGKPNELLERDINENLKNEIQETDKNNIEENEYFPEKISVLEYLGNHELVSESILIANLKNQYSLDTYEAKYILGVLNRRGYTYGKPTDRGAPGFEITHEGREYLIKHKN